MTFFQNLWADLVEKRLLPVIAILIVLLIAVPLLLGRTKDPETPPPAPAIASTDDISSPGKVTLAPNTDQPTFVQRTGHRTNPFRRKEIKRKATKVASAGTSLGKSLSGGATSGTTAVQPVTTVKAAPAANDTISLQFGQGGALADFKSVNKLTPLPDDDDPLFVFTNFAENGKSAEFLISADATATGDGRCKPSAGNCQQVILSAGDIEFFDVPSGTGGMTQYELHVTAVHSKNLNATAKKK